jgi:hypothetical protein
MPSSPTYHVDAEAAFDTLSRLQKLIVEAPDKGEKLRKTMGIENPESAIRKLLLEEENDINLQMYLAKYLRQAAIDHLGSGKTDFTKTFRQNYEEIFAEGGITAPLDHFLEYQGKNKFWSTEVEAGALGNLFNITVVVTPITRGVKQSSFTVNESTDKNAPIIRLYNRGNKHWYLEPFKPEATIGDGNCLYNAFAQALRQTALYQKILNDVKKQKTPNVTPGAKAIFKKQEKLKEDIGNIKEIDMSDLIDKITMAKVSNRPAAKKPTHNERSEITEEKSAKDFPDYDEFIPSRPYDPASVNFRDEIMALTQKAGELKNKSMEQSNYKPAALKAHHLVVSLNKAAISYFNAGKMTPKEFINYGNKKIKEARPELEKHRGWSQILGNLALAIVGVGVGYLVLGILNKALTGRFLFFRTESGEKLDDMQRAVKNHNRFKSR